MNFAFKGFFESPAEAEAAYYALRDKDLVSDLETSDLTHGHFTDMAPQIAYASGGNTMLVSPAASSSLIFGTLGNSDPRVTMTPFLADPKKEEASSSSDAYYLYGHCRKKDIDAVSACLKRCGAYSVLSSQLERPSRLHHDL